LDCDGEEASEGKNKAWIATAKRQVKERTKVGLRRRRGKRRKERTLSLVRYVFKDPPRFVGYGRLRLSCSLSPSSLLATAKSAYAKRRNTTGKQPSPYILKEPLRGVPPGEQQSRCDSPGGTPLRSSSVRFGTRLGGRNDRGHPVFLAPLSQVPREPTAQKRAGKWSGYARKNNVFDADNRLILLQSRGSAFSAKPRTPSTYVTLRNRTTVIRVDLGGWSPQTPHGGIHAARKGPASLPARARRNQPDNERNGTWPAGQKCPSCPVRPPGRQSSAKTKRKARALRRQQTRLAAFGGLWQFSHRTS
jgi:hypothetical protein